MSSSHANGQRSTIQLLQEFSLPLLAGVGVALLVANFAPAFYDHLVHTPITQYFSANAHHAGETVAATGAHAAASHAETSWWTSHFFSMHFLVNDIFMVLFFGVAAKEITEACLPGGALNPPSKAINPLLGTLGGVLGPIGVFLLANALLGQPEWTRGWGIPTATDIALAWLVARAVFGARHPAVSFLLLLAVADDAIGLGIIAFGYPDPAHATQWLQTAWLIPGMLVAFGLRKFQVNSWVPYIGIGGTLCWYGLFSAHLHPALALVFIVPFLPGPKRDLGLFTEPRAEDLAKVEGHDGTSALERFEHALKLPVDLGLFFFAFANAGVPFSGVTGLTWLVFFSLWIGKMVGITGFSYLGTRLGFPLPEGMQFKQLVMASMVAAVGLTVALFVSTQAFVEPGLQGSAKMGALFSGLLAVLSVAVGRVLGMAPAKTKSTASWSSDQQQAAH